MSRLSAFLSVVTVLAGVHLWLAEANARASDALGGDPVHQGLLPDAATSHVLTDVTLLVEGVELRIEQLEWHSAEPKQKIEAIIQMEDRDAIGIALGEINAEKIKIIGLNVIYGVYETRYESIELRDVKNGRASSVTTRGAVTACALSEFKIEYAKAKNVNLDKLIKFSTMYVEKNPQEMIVLHDNHVSKGITYATTNGFYLRIGKVYGDQYASKMVRRPLTVGDWIHKDPNHLDLEDIQNASDLLISQIDWIRLSNFDFEDISIRYDEQTKFHAARGRIEANQEGRPIGASLGDFRFEGPRFGFSIGEIKGESFSIEPVLRALRLAAVDPTALLHPDVVQESLPEVGRWSLSNVNVNAKSDGAERAWIFGSLLFDTRDRHYGIPSKITVALENFLLQIGDSPILAPLADLRDLEYDKLDISAGFTIGWDSMRPSITLDALYVHVEDLGAITLGATVSEVSDAVFRVAAGQSLPALMAGRLDSVVISVKDQGGADKLRALYAERSGMPIEVGDASALIAAMAGLAPEHSRAARGLTEAIESFLAEPGALEIVLLPQDGDGPRLAELMADLSLGRVLDYFDLHANRH